MTAPAYTLHLGHCLEVLRTLPDGSVDAVVTDPPYGLTNRSGGPHGRGAATPYARSRAGAARGGFMRLAWDAGVPPPEVWREVLRVCKPGAYLLSFGHARTYHRMVCAVEDAGFEVRDQIMWIYGSGFPKSHNLDGAWEGWGTALKPAHEPILLARKPLAGTVARNVDQIGTGAINISGCRVPVDDGVYARNCSGDRGHSSTRAADRQGATNLRAGGGRVATGRWPANVVHDGSAEVIQLFPSVAGAKGAVHSRSSDKFSAVYGTFAGMVAEGATFDGERASAARFFYCAKATRRDRNEGVLGGSDAPAVRTRATMRQVEDADWKARNANDHPTVKPTDLMRWLVRLVTPPGGTVLDPYAGSGSTGKAAILEGFDFIGIELGAGNVEIAEQRCAFALVERQRELQDATAARQQDLFA